MEHTVEKGHRLWFRLVLFVLPYLVSAYFRLVDLTSKKVLLNQQHEEAVCKKRPFTCACFHGTMLFPIYYCRRYPGVIMVSRSWDGDLIDRCLRRWGFSTTRGSSSRGGKDALAEMIEIVKDTQCNAGLAVDAPRGPSRKAKMGIIMLARETGTPVVPLVSWATRQIQFNSWDKMILPLPFSTIVMAFGKPVEISPDLEREEYEGFRKQIEDEMHDISQQAQDAVESLFEAKGRWSVNRV